MIKQDNLASFRIHSLYTIKESSDLFEYQVDLFRNIHDSYFLYQYGEEEKYMTWFATARVHES